MFPLTSVDLFPRTDGVEKGAFDSYQFNSKYVETVVLMSRTYSINVVLQENSDHNILTKIRMFPVNATVQTVYLMTEFCSCNLIF